MLTEKNPIRFFVVVSVFLTALFFLVFALFPENNQYFPGADEGTYLKNAKIIEDKGIIDGFAQVTGDFIQNPSMWDFPNPFRIAYYILAAPFSAKGMTGLSIVSALGLISVLAAGSVFIRRLWGSRAALFTVVLLGLSPLWLAISRRALSDMTMYASLLITMMAFIWYLRDPDFRRLMIFTAVLSVSGFFKELNFITVPFYSAYSLYFHFFRLKQQRPFFKKIVHPFLIAVVPVVLFFCIYALLCSPSGLKELLYILTHFSTKCEYGMQYGSGGWYQYLIDFFLLSPPATLLFFGAVAYLIFNRSKPFDHGNILYIFLFFWIYIIIVYHVFSKNVRYVGFLEWIHYLFAVLFIVKLTEYFSFKRNNLIISSVFFIILWLNVSNFNNIFITNAVYDTVAYNLWQNQMYVEIDKSVVTKITTDFSYRYRQKPYKNGIAPVVKPDETDYYLSRSFSCFRSADYDSCIAICRQGLLKNPDPVTAAGLYNNMCASYNNQGKFYQALEAGKMAVKLKPDYELARNNMAFSLRELKKREGSNKKTLNSEVH